MKKKKIPFISFIIGFLIILVGVVCKIKKPSSIAVIGGADGPTSIFIAGKAGDPFPYWWILVGVAILVVSAFWIIKKKNNKS